MSASASDPNLHSLSRAVDPGEIQFTVQGAAASGESYSVECVFRPWRDRDVKKSRHLNLLGGWIGGGSPGLMKVQREEFHSVRHAIPASGDSPGLQLAPPQGVLVGVHVEIFWPEGESLEFPETNFERDVDVIAVPVSKLPRRMIELLGLSVRLRPGMESSSVSAGEWREMEEAVPEIPLPWTMEMASAGGGKTVLKIARRPGFNEPWVCVFGAPYDGNRRYRMSTLLVGPERWSGRLPE